MKYTEKLQRAVKAAKSTLCVGLDPNPDLLPEAVRRNFDTIEEQVLIFCKLIIDYTSDHCAAYKPNMGFFESLGDRSFDILDEVIKHIPKDKIIIADAKRGDISSTSEHYKKAFFDKMNVDAITLNPLMGFETLDAFSHDESKAIYVLTLTSNTGAADFLKKPFNGFNKMAEYIAHTLSIRSADSKTHLGMVIGATQAGFATSILAHHREGSLLIPGIGAQGGSLEDLTHLLENHNGIPMINSSRAIIYAGRDVENWPEIVASKAAELKKQLEPITEMYV